jgi:hypothetical protein
VAAIFSEERYGWFTRLQKITFAGGGVELAALAPTGATTTDRTPLGAGRATGANRIDYLLFFMSSLPAAINRDLGYARETGHTWPDDAHHADLEFASQVVGPLGARLRAIHAIRRYNDLGFMIDRGFIDDFRAFVRGYLAFKRMPPGQSDPFRLLVERIKEIWRDTCDLDRQLRRAAYFAPAHSAAAPQEDDTCAQEAKRAERFLDRTVGRPDSQPGIELNPELPYGTLLSSMLLYAAGETDSAVRDLERWITLHPVGDQRAFRRIGVYRARYISALLLTRDNPENENIHVAFNKYQDTLEMGDRLLSSSFPANVMSWRAQRARLDQSDRQNTWNTVDCSEDLSANFKQFARAYLVAKNNLTYFLSQNLELAKLERRDATMRRFADDLAKANILCLRLNDSPDEQAATRSLQATVLDTAASVQLELGLREDQRGEKRALLCKAQQHIQAAVEVYGPVTQRPTLPKWVNAREKGATQAPQPWQEQETWSAEENRLHVTETMATLLRRQQRVQATLIHAGFVC